MSNAGVIKVQKIRKIKKAGIFSLLLKVPAF